MDSFENYLPDPSGKDKSSKKRMSLNIFSQGKEVEQWPLYQVIYGKDIEWTAYDKPGVRTYNMDVVNSAWVTEYNWGRWEFNYTLPSEDYNKPPLIQTGSFIYTWEASSNKENYSYDTLNLPVFLQSVNERHDLVLKDFWKDSKEYKEFEKSIIFIFADMQRVWASDGNYNTDIIPSAGKIWKIQALRNSLKQLGKDIPSDETMFEQWSLWNNPEKVICRDFSIVISRMAKSLGFEAVAWTIEVGISHAFTTIRSKETWEYYWVSADSVGGPSKVFQGKSLHEIRTAYQNHLLSLDRASYFGWVFLDDNGKVIGKWSTDLEKHRASDFLGGDMPSRLLSQSMGRDLSINHGSIGGVNYTSLIAKKWIDVDGDIIDTEVFFKWWITRMWYNQGEANVIDLGVGSKLSSKSYEISSGFKARAYVAADINISVGFSSEKWTQVPYLSGNSVVWGTIQYEKNKWIFTTDLGKSYELSWPNQMQRPIIKLLPSWEYAIFSGTYKWESMNILGRAVMENYFSTERKELSLGIKGSSWYSWAVFHRTTKDSIPWFSSEVTRETGIWIGGEINKNTNWKLETSRNKWATGADNSVNAWIEIKF